MPKCGFLARMSVTTCRSNCVIRRPGSKTCSFQRGVLQPHSPAETLTSIIKIDILFTGYLPLQALYDERAWVKNRKGHKTARVTSLFSTICILASRASVQPCSLSIASRNARPPRPQPCNCSSQSSAPARSTSARTAVAPDITPVPVPRHHTDPETLPSALTATPPLGLSPFPTPGEPSANARHRAVPGCLL
jgi:hypothetical protein